MTATSGEIPASAKMKPSPKVVPHGIEVLECTRDDIGSATRKELCDLKGDMTTEVGISKSIETTRAYLATLAASPEHSVSEAAKKTIDPEHIRSWIVSPGGSQYEIRIPRGVEVGQEIPLTLSGKQVILKRLGKNGYNSEFEIKGPDGKSWVIVGSLFTVNNPRYTQIQSSIEDTKLELRAEQSRREKSQAEMAQIERLLSSPAKQMSGKKKGKSEDSEKRKKELLERKSFLQSEIQKATTEQRRIEGEIQGLQVQGGQIPRYASFPYVPYQSVLDTPARRTEGIKHIGRVITEVYEKIVKEKSMIITEQRPVYDKSGKLEGYKEEKRSVPTIDIHTKAPPELAILLNIIERMDYQVYYKTIPAYTIDKEVIVNGKNGRKSEKKIIQERVPPQEVLRDKTEVDALMLAQSRRSLVTFGLNQSDAYKWQRSTVGALGIAQLMPKTYEDFQYKYSLLSPSAGVPDDHETGAKDQKFSARFQIMHLYDEYYQLPLWIRKNWDTIIADRQARIGLYSILAAGYNGTMSRVISEAGLSGDKAHTISELYPENLRDKFTHNKERYTYVLKLEYLYGRYFPEKKK